MARIEVCDSIYQDFKPGTMRFAGDPQGGCAGGVSVLALGIFCPAVVRCAATGAMPRHGLAANWYSPEPILKTAALFSRRRGAILGVAPWFTVTV